MELLLVPSLVTIVTMAQEAQKHSCGFALQNQYFWINPTDESIQ